MRCFEARLGARALICALAVAVASPALAEAEQDDNAGTWTDRFRDDTGISPPEQHMTVNVEHDAVGQRVVLSQGAAEGTLATTPIEPSSFSAWAWLYVSAEVPSDANLSVYALDEDSGDLYGAGGAVGTLANPPAEGLALVASDDAAFSGRADISMIAQDVGVLRVIVVLQATTLRPAVTALRVTWKPESVVSLVIDGPETRKSAETLDYRINVAVSFVDAVDLVVEAPLPTLTHAPLRAQDTDVTFVSATSGGVLTADGKVRWQLGTRKAGDTFLLVYQARTNMGLHDGSEYAASAAATSSNGGGAEAAPVETTIEATPQPYVRKSVSVTYRLDNKDYAFPDSTVTFSVTGGNYVSWPGRGGEELFDPVVWDDVSALLPILSGGPASDITDISDNGLFTSEAKTIGAVTVPANSIYWEVDDLSVREGFSRSYKVKLPDTEGLGPFTGCAHHESAYAAQSDHDAAPACRTFYIDQLDDPQGIFAKGEEVRGRRQITAGHDDLTSPVQMKVGFGETYSYLVYTRNTSISTLNDLVMIDMIPEGLAFEGAYAAEAAGATIYYNTATDAPNRLTPPDYTEDLAAATYSFGTSWTTDAPEDPSAVTWVAFVVPALSSTYFPEAGVPNSVTGEIAVTVKPPDGDCPEGDITLDNEGIFRVFAYTPPNGGQKQAPEGGALAYTDIETSVVAPDLPNLATSWLSDSPSTAVADQPLRYTFTIRNANPGNVQSPLDTAHGLVASIAIPKVQANGVPTRLLLTQVQTGGAPFQITDGGVDVGPYPPLAQGASRSITLDLRVPPGVIDGTTWSVSATASATDDLCGPVSVARTEATGFFGLPALKVRKSADFSFGQPGTELVYRIEYTNSALTPSTDSWVVDRVPPGIALGEIQVPTDDAGTPVGEVWVSSALADALPGALSPSDPLTRARIAANFQRVADGDGDGSVISPLGAATTWIAWRVDDLTLSPPQLVAGSLRAVHWSGLVTNPQVGSIIANEAAVLSKELIQAIGNKVLFTVTGRPGLRITKSCADVVSAGETFTYMVAYDNDSANQDAGALIEETAPDGLTIVGVTHEYNDAHGPGDPVALTFDGASVTLSAGPLGPREGGTLFIEAKVTADITSGTFLVTETLGTATNEQGEARSAYADCATLVENSDLFMRKLVDNPKPRAGEVVTFTLLVSNEGANLAEGVVISDALPEGLSYVDDSAIVTPAPWHLAAGSNPALVDDNLTWGPSPATDNALTFGGLDPGTFPGRSGDVALIFRAKVDDSVLPGTTLQNCASALTTSGEDHNFDNSACASITTPLPDPYIAKTGPVVKKPGERASYTLTYGNNANEVAGGVVVIDSLPDGPSPRGDGAVDLTYLGYVGAGVESVWFHHGTPGAAPAFDRGDPASGEWTDDPTAGDISHVAFFVGDLAPYAAPKKITVNLLMTAPGGGQPVIAGSIFDNVATVAMTTSGFDDDNASNNSSTWTTKVPGIDLSADKTCDPSGGFPGVQPGDTVNFALTVVNSGTVNAHGITLTDRLPANLALVAFSGEAALSDADGQPVAAIDNFDAVIDGGVRWTGGDGVYRLGGDAYRSVGLRPGHRAELQITARVGDEVTNQTVITNAATAATDLVAGAPSDAPRELILGNNRAECGFTVYRADPFLGKAVVNLTTGSETIADAGDILSYTLSYGNAGNFEAEGVFIEDAIPDGTTFVLGSVSNIDPEVMEVQYSDDGGLSYGYRPSGDSGDTDPGVTHIRVVWTEALGAPAGNIFVQDTYVDFQPGEHLGTAPDEDIDGVVPLGRSVCDDVLCQKVLCDAGSYIPEDGCCPACRPSVPGCGDVAPVEIVECVLGSGKDATWSGCYEVNATGCTGSCVAIVRPPPGEVDPYREANAACSDVYEHNGTAFRNCLKQNQGDLSQCETQGERLWDACWTPTCPETQAWDCEVQRHAVACAKSYMIGLEQYLGCLEAHDVPTCEWLLPRDDCGACQNAVCDATPDGLKTLANYPIEAFDNVINQIDDVVTLLMERQEAPPEDLLVWDISRCKEPTSCVAGLTVEPKLCLQECTIQDKRCRQCKNGAMCGCCLEDEACLIIIGETPAKTNEAIPAAPIQVNANTRACEAIDAQLAFYHEVCVEVVGPNAPICELVRPLDCGGIGDVCEASQYTSPVFPTDGEGQVVTWERAFVHDAHEDANTSVSYSVVDPSTGEPVPGFASMPSPDDGVIDISGIDPADYPNLQLRAEFVGKSGGLLWRINDDADVPMIEGASIIPWQMDESGRVVGTVSGVDSDFGYVSQTFVWDRDGGFEMFPLNETNATTYTYMSPYGMSDAGHVVGDKESILSFDPVRAFFHSEATGLIDIADFELGDYDDGNASTDDNITTMTAGAVNDAGLVAGYVSLITKVTSPGGPSFLRDGRHPFVWTHAGGLVVNKDIHVLQHAGGNLRINDSGVVLGVGSRHEGVSSVFTWDPSTGEVTWIAEVATDYYEIIGLTDNGTVAYNDDDSAWVWHADDGLREVALPGVYGVYASNTNDDGVVVGYGGSPFDIGGAVAWILRPGEAVERIDTGDAPLGGAAVDVTNAGDVLLAVYDSPRLQRRPTSWLAVWDGSGAPKRLRHHEADATEMYAADLAWSGLKSMNDKREVAATLSFGLGDIIIIGQGRQALAVLYAPNEGALALLDWRAIYRTDRNPFVGFQAAVDDMCQTAIDNRAEIFTTSPEVTASNNQGAASISVNYANLEVSLTVDKAAFNPQVDSELSYTLEVTNHGPGAADDVVVTVAFPDGVDGAGVESLPIGRMEPGSTVSDGGVRAVHEVAADTTLVATASVDSSTIDCTPDDDVASATTVIGSWPNVYATIDGPDAATAQAETTYTILVGNNGNDIAEGAVLTYVAPPGLVVSSASPLQSGEDEVAPQIDGGVVTWPIGVIPDGGEGEATVTLGGADCAAAGTSITGEVLVTTTSPEFDTSDNADAVTTRILAPAGAFELAVAESFGAASPGDEVTYTVYFRNVGAATVDASVLDVQLPAGTDYAPESASGGGRMDDGRLIWPVAAMAPGASLSVNFNAVVLSGERGPGLASLGGAGACPVAAPFGPPAAVAGSLSLTKAADRDVICGALDAGEVITWSITAGGRDGGASGVTITDTIPAGLAYVPGSITGRGADDSDPRNLRWAVGAVGGVADQGVTVTFETMVVAALPGVVVSNGAVATFDDGATVHSGAAAVINDCQPRATLTKSWSAGCAAGPGEAVVITLTATNRGEAPVAGAIVKDVFPEAVAFISASEGTWLEETRTFEAAVDLSPNRPRTITIQARLREDVAPGTVFTNEGSLYGFAGVMTTSNRVGGVLLHCDDLNACTANACDLTAGCVFAAVEDGSKCDDGDACSRADSCQDGACFGDDVVVCAASDQCHDAGVCDTTTGECSDPVAANGTGCDDDRRCTEEDSCVDGVCVGAAVACDDNNACTEDSCNEEVGCDSSPVEDGTACEDSNACAAAARCEEGTCVVKAFIACDDRDPCTDDSCDPEVGCVTTVAARGTACDDDNPCTLEDHCDEGQCGGTERACGVPGICEEPGTCNPDTGVCDYPVKDGDVPMPIGLRDVSGAEGRANGLNDRGDVVGEVTSEAGTHAFFWSTAGGLVDIAPDAARSSRALDVNSDGLVVGLERNEEANETVVFVWDGNATILGPLSASDITGGVFGPTSDGIVAFNGDSGLMVRDSAGSRTVSVPSGASLLRVRGAFDPGTLVGDIVRTAGGTDGFVWTAAGGLASRVVSGESVSLNAASVDGYVGGYAEAPAGARHAVVWDPSGGPKNVTVLCDVGTGTSLPCLDESWVVGIAAGGLVLGDGVWTDVGPRAWVGPAGRDGRLIEVQGAQATRAVAINDAGMVLGAWQNGAGQWFAFVWTQDEGARRLPTVGRTMLPTELTGSGYVAGSYVNSAGMARAFLWSADRGFDDLGTLGGSNAWVTAANAAGQVAGFADPAEGPARAYVSGVPKSGCVACEDDNTPPRLYCPAPPPAIECVNGGVSLALGSPSARDDCSFPVAVDVQRPELYELGTSQVIWTATDAVGNSATCGVTVTVVDTLAPVIACPDLVEVTSDANKCGAIVALPITAVDACSGISDLTMVGAEPRRYPIGDTAVTVTAVDAVGHQAVCETVVRVIDTSPLEIVCPAAVTVDAPPDYCGHPEALVATVVDQCLVEITVTSSQDGFPIGVSTAEYTAENGVGETASCDTKVTVIDATAPTVACDAPPVLLGNHLPGTYAPRVYDACTADVEIDSLTCAWVDSEGSESNAEACEVAIEGGAVVIRSVGTEDGDDSEPGVAVVSWSVTATDPSGNVGTAECRTQVLRDRDGDGIIDTDDNCVGDFNPMQIDTDLDDIGNACDLVEDGIIAAGGGGCQGGGPTPGLLALVALLALALWRRRRAARG